MNIRITTQYQPHLSRCTSSEGFNSLLAKSIQVGTKNSSLEGFLLAKHTAHKHPHHDGAVRL